MADDAVDAKAWYEQHADAEREYVRVYAAIPVQPGDHWVEEGVFSVVRGVKEPGYKVKAYSDLQECSETFLTKDEFAAKAVDAGKLYPSVKPEDPSAEDLAAMEPIKKGKDYIAGKLFAAAAECDGFLYHTAKGDIFLSNYAVSTVFNYAGKKCETDGAMVVSMKDEAPVKGIIVGDDVTFDFKAGAYKAEKGSFLMPNPDDEDGFTAYPPGFAAFALRRNLSDEVMAAVADVKTDEEIKVGHALRFKPKL